MTASDTLGMSILDYVSASAARAGRATLVVQTDGLAHPDRIDDEFAMLPEAAREELKDNRIAIVEFGDDESLIDAFRSLSLDEALRGSSMLAWRLDAMPCSGRSLSHVTATWN